MQRQLPPHRSSRRPVAEFLSFLAGLVVLGVAFFLGLFFVAVVAGLLLLGAAAVAVRVWWLKRRIRRAVAADGEGRVIEGEYTVTDSNRSRRMTGERRR